MISRTFARSWRVVGFVLDAHTGDWLRSAYPPTSLGGELAGWAIRADADGELVAGGGTTTRMNRPEVPGGLAIKAGRCCRGGVGRLVLVELYAAWIAGTARRRRTVAGDPPLRGPLFITVTVGAIVASKVGWFEISIRGASPDTGSIGPTMSLGQTRSCSMFHVKSPESRKSNFPIGTGGRRCERCPTCPRAGP